MSNVTYEMLLPLSAEPATGFQAGQQIDFQFPDRPGRALKPGSLRLTGLLSTTILGTPVSGQLSMNPNAGAHSLIDYVYTSFSGEQVEGIVQYPRQYAAKQEARRSCLELGALTSDVVQLCAVSQDGEKDLLTAQPLCGQISGEQQFKAPFSIKLDICLNKASGPLSFQKTGPIHLRFVMNQPSDIFTQVGNNEIYPSEVSYSVTNMALRYMTQDEDEDSRDKVVMTRTSFAGIQNVLSSFNTFSTVSPISFDRTFVVFRDATHTNSAELAYDSILNEAFILDDKTQLCNYFEVTIGGDDQPLSFPLRGNNTEMLGNYLMALVGSEQKHGLNLAKLNLVDQGKQSCGYGLGCQFGRLYPAGVPVQLTLNFKESVDRRYNAYIYYSGAMAI